MKMTKFKVALIALLLSGNIMAQQKTEVTARAGKGIEFKSEDNLFYLKFRTRIQTRWDFNNYSSAGSEESYMENKAWVKRSRLKFDGYILDENLTYKIEYDVVGGYVRDAMIKYKMNNVQLWFGQGKLPGNRERVVSSANMQLVDRSIFNANYTIDRDLGIQMHHQFNIGKAIIYDRWAITSGDGIRNNKFAKGVSLTGKLEVLPLGEFASKGLYKSADLAREETVKLAFAGYANFNPTSYKDRGQIGTDIGGEADLLNLGGDFLMKYKGMSLMLEAGTRSVVGGDEFITDEDGNVSAYYTGYGANLQGGYVFKNNWELSGRYAFTNPNETEYHSEIKDLTFGVSKYILGHSFKFQGDVTLRDLAGEDVVIGRLQMELQF